ncbi:MNIO family chryseobactin maturase [Chryseobacterium artocarpi]|uniref:MNIO family chryseobactin maturase n=1 Tax=Chryseobacterium artocarpi TaxID=1414727 RepID=UPI003F2D5044
MKKPLLGISMMAESEFVSAILPLLQSSSIEVLEWSFDTFYNVQEPVWLSDLLNFYSENNRLIGHGVYYSLFDAKWSDRQEVWLERLKQEIKKRQYKHLTEHFGFMNTENFHQGVPLPVSLHSQTLQIGKDRLHRLQDAVEIPVGIENLAFSFSVDDVKEQGLFLDKLIEEIDGFLILDLHNIYCQACNFDVDMQEIIQSYPLDKVKEIHLSGGSWHESIYRKKSIRRDTHDDDIPDEIWAVLPSVLLQCKNVQYVIIERLGYSIKTERDKQNFLSDFVKAQTIINVLDWSGRENRFWSKKEVNISKKPLEDAILYEEQTRLTKLLFDSVDPILVKKQDFQYFNTETWNEEMIMTAQNILKKWNPY